MTEVRKDRRAPASLKVKYKCATVDDFVEQLAGDVSRGGIFIKTKKPLEPAALLKFEFQLQDGAPVLYGVGRVAWRRAEAAARPGLPAGMGIKFIKLNGESRGVVEQIEAKHGPVSRYEQTDGAELAASISSLPPAAEGLASLAPPASGAAPDNGNADGHDVASVESMRPDGQEYAFGAEPPTVRARRLSNSSPPLREARVSGLKASGTSSLLPPPPASSSVPPARSAASAPAPRGALGSAGPARRTASARSSARDASEFLATAFSVGGAGRELRTAAQAQAERARTDPRSVDLATELFGDLDQPSPREHPDATLEGDPVLGSLSLTAEAGGRLSLNGQGQNDDPNSPHGAPTKRPPAAAANDQLSLSLGSQGTVSGARAPVGGRGLWLVALAVLCVAGGAAFYMLQSRSAPAPTSAAPLPAAAASGSPEQPPLVSWSVSSEPTGASVSVDGEERGTTPTTLELQEGKTVEVRVYSPGFAAQTQSVAITKDMASKSFALVSLPFELVVTQPKGVKVKVGDKSVEAPTPLALGPLEPSVEEVTVTFDKPGFQRATRKLSRSEFQERDSVMRAELAVTLTPLTAGAERKTAAVRGPAPASEPPAPDSTSTSVGSASSPQAPVVQVKEAPPLAEGPQASPPAAEAPPEPTSAAASPAPAASGSNTTSRSAAPPEPSAPATAAETAPTPGD